MRIITWNVNGLRAVEKKGELQDLITRYHPDLLFLQEIKGSPDKFSSYLNSPDGYEAFYNSAEKPGYAGTGVWISQNLKKYLRAIETTFAGDPTANEGRVVHVMLEDAHSLFDIFGIYFPNGGKNPAAWQDKLVFYQEFLHEINLLREEHHRVIWMGDINCAHHAIDLARPRENDGKIGFHPTERAWLDRCVDEDWHDIWRDANPTTTEVYSWWDPVTRARERNVGWRLDAIWGDASLMDQVSRIEYLSDQMGSDHCPMLVEFPLGEAR